MNWYCFNFLLILSSYQIIYSSRATLLCKDASTRPLQTTYNLDWRVWLRAQGRSYPSSDVCFRFRIWVSNFIELESHNNRYRQGKELYMKGTNRFSDGTAKELRQLLQPETSLSKYYTELNPVTLLNVTVPEDMNWVRGSWITPVKAQVLFANGWAVSAVEAIQAQNYRLTGSRQRLSMKEILDCVVHHPNRPLTSMDAFSYIQANGVTFDSIYRMDLQQPSPCKNRIHNPKKYIREFHLLEPHNEENLKIAVSMIGPISVHIRVTANFFFYKSGIFYDSSCGFGDIAINHGVLLVGYGSDPVGVDFWVVQNSWGKQWGEKGFARMIRNSGLNCGIASAAFYPVL